jgi:hypothetical protein
MSGLDGKKVNFRFPQLLLCRYLSFVYKPLVQVLIYASWAVLGEGCSSACGREAPGAFSFRGRVNLLAHCCIH